jgi:hypothetical protein
MNRSSRRGPGPLGGSVQPRSPRAVSFTTDEPTDEAEGAEDAPANDESPEANVVELRRGRRPRQPSA